MKNSTIVLKDSHRAAPTGKVIGEVAPNKVLYAAIQTPTAMSAAAIERLVFEVQHGLRAPLKPRQLKRVLGSKTKHVRANNAAIRSCGLTVDKRTAADEAHGIIRFHGTYAAFKKFSPNLKLVVVEDGKGNKVITRQGPLSVFTNLPIVGLFGLDEREVAHTNYHIHKPSGNKPQVIPAGLTSRGLAKLQGWDVADMDATVRVTGYISLGGDNVKCLKDLATAARKDGIKSANVIRVSTDGTPNGDYSDDATVENILDLLAQALLNPNGYVIQFCAGNSDDAFAGAAEAANVYPGVKVGKTTLKLSSLTISWGMAESANTPQSLQRWARIGTASQLVGLDITAATGDNGPDDSTQAATPDAPSCVPNIKGAAGEGITSSDGKTVASRAPWDDTANGGGETGYGISSLFPPMPEEAGLDLPVSAVTNKPGHSASVFMDIAQPASGPALPYNGKWIQVGGTSHSAPIQGAKESYLKAKYGIVSFLAFGYANGPAIVDKITVGDDSGPYPADPSKDYNVMTGFGEINPTKAGAVAKKS